MILQRLFAFALAVSGAASLPFLQTAAPPPSISPLILAFYQERANATDNCTVTLYTNWAVGPDTECGLLQYYPTVSDSLKRVALRLHVRAATADGPAPHSKGYQVRLCSVCELGWCHEFAKKSMSPGEKKLEVDVPQDVLLKSKEGFRVRVSVIAKGKNRARKQPSCENAALQFVTNDTESLLAPVLLIYKESSPTYFRDLLLQEEKEE